MKDINGQHENASRPAKAPAVKEKFDPEKARARKERKAARLTKAKEVSPAVVVEQSPAPTHVVPRSWEDLVEEDVEPWPLIPAEEPVAPVASSSNANPLRKARKGDQRPPHGFLPLGGVPRQPVNAVVHNPVHFAMSTEKSLKTSARAVQKAPPPIHRAPKLAAVDLEDRAFYHAAHSKSISPAVRREVQECLSKAVGIRDAKHALDAEKREKARDDLAISCGRAGAIMLGGAQAYVLPDGAVVRECQGRYHNGVMIDLPPIRDRLPYSNPLARAGHYNRDLQPVEAPAPELPAPLGVQETENPAPAPVEDDVSHILKPVGQRKKDKLQPRLKTLEVSYLAPKWSWCVPLVVLLLWCLICIGMPAAYSVFKHNVILKDGVWITSWEKAKHAAWVVERQRRICPSPFLDRMPNGKINLNPICVFFTFEEDLQRSWTDLTEWLRGVDNAVFETLEFEAGKPEWRMALESFLGAAVWDDPWANRHFFFSLKWDGDRERQLLTDIAIILRPYWHMFQLVANVSLALVFGYVITIAILGWMNLLTETLTFTAVHDYTTLTEEDLRCAVFKTTPLTEEARMVECTVVKRRDGLLARVLLPSWTQTRSARIELGLLISLLSPQIDVQSLTDADQFKRIQEGKRFAALQNTPHTEMLGDYIGNACCVAWEIIRARRRARSDWGSTYFPTDRR